MRFASLLLVASIAAGCGRTAAQRREVEALRAEVAELKTRVARAQADAQAAESAREDAVRNAATIAAEAEKAAAEARLAQDSALLARLRPVREEVAGAAAAQAARSRSELAVNSSRLVVIDLATAALARRAGGPAPASPEMTREELRALVPQIAQQRAALVAQMDEAPEGTDVREAAEWRNVLDLAAAEAKKRLGD